MTQAQQRRIEQLKADLEAVKDEITWHLQHNATEMSIAEYDAKAQALAQQRGKLEAKIFSTAIRMMPAWACSAVDNCVSDSGETLQALIDGVRHEMDLAMEQQDGCINAKQFAQGQRFLKKLGVEYAY